MMIGLCDTCERLAQVVELPGRRDRNCPECNKDIATLTLLYPALKQAKLEPEAISRLEAEIKSTMERLFRRAQWQEWESSLSARGREVCYATSSRTC
jgi:hypothetical protein